MFSMSQTVEEFMIQIARTAQPLVPREKVQQLNQTIGSHELGRKKITFDGIEGTAKTSYSTTGRDVLRGMVAAVVDPADYERAMGQKFAGTAHQARMTRPLQEYLTQQGISFDSGDTTTALLFTPESLSSGRTEATILHEFGHAASLYSGVQGADKSGAAHSAYNFVQDLLSRDVVGLDDARAMHQKVSSVLITNALEEARAESFSFQSLQKNLIKSGVPVENITKNLLEQPTSAYNAPGTYRYHFSSMTQKVKEVYEKMGESIKDLESPLTGKTGLSVEEMIEDLSYYTRSQAAGTFRGVMESSLPGELGQIYQEKVKIKNLEVEEALTKIPEHQAEPIPRIIKQYRDQAMAKPRPVDIVDWFTDPIQAQVTSTRPRLSVSSAPSADSLYDDLTEEISSRVAVRRTGQSGRLLQSAAKASQSVAKRDSIGLRLAGAATSILRRRVF